MSNSCFPKLSCFKGKNKVKSAMQSSELKSQELKLSLSMSKLNPPVQTSKVDSLVLNDSLPDLSKTSKYSNKAHKSMKAIRCLDKFKPLDYKRNIEREDPFPCLNISKISDVFISDNSYIDIFNEKNEENKAEIRKENNQRLPRASRFLKCIGGIKSKELPMFIRNPSFNSYDSISIDLKK